MAFNYGKYITLILNKIDYYGGWITYIQNVDGAVNTATGLMTYNTISIPIKALVVPYNKSLIDGNNVRKTDRQVIIQSTMGKPRVDDNLNINGEFFKVIEVIDYAPGVVDTLVYVIQARAYSAARSIQEIDVLKVTLGTLELGTIVKDPNALENSPEWRVIAHNHHNIGITTLMCEKVWEFFSFDGTYEGYGYFPDTPWKSSYMRYRLNNNFIDLYFSADLANNLQIVELETQGNLWNDKVSLLSIEELFDNIVTNSSGSYITYFASDALRIGRWFEDDLPLEYWTRDVYSWTPPNGIIMTVNTDGTKTSHISSNRAGVRPIIFMANDLEVILNADGKYSFDW